MVAPTAASIVQAIPSRKRKRQRARPDDADMLTPAATNSGKSRRTTPPATLTPHKYGTRTALHGRDETTYSKYDTKFHEMDRHTRPKYAARRHGNSQAKMSQGSESPMVNVKTSKVALIATPDADDDSDDDDYGNNDEDDDDDNNDNDDENEDDDTERGVVEREAPSSRKPDPRASRHSARSSAKKAIDYRMKRHPQDFAIPGYQHLTAARKAAPRSKLAARPKPKPQGRKSRAPDEDVLDLSTEPDDVDDLVEEAITKSIRSTPKAATTIRTDRAPEGAPSQQHDTSDNDPEEDSHIGIETKCKSDSGNEAKDEPEDGAARRTDVGPKTGPGVDSENSKQDCPNPNRLLSDGSKSSKSSKSSVTWPRGLPSLSERRCSSASGSMMSAWTEHETSEVWHDAQADTEHSRAASTIPGARAEARASSPADATTFNGLPEDTLSDNLAEVSSLQEVLEQDLATHEAAASLAASSDIWLNE